MENTLSYPLTHPQQRIWYTEMMQPGTSFANIAVSVRLKKGLINLELLKRAINLAVKFNDALRIRIIPDDSDARQYVAEYQEFDLELIQEPGLDEWLVRQSQTPFALPETDLYYFALLKYAEDSYGFYIKLHHLISDGFSFSILTKQIMEYYEQLAAGQAGPEKPKPSFFDYFKREEKYLTSLPGVKDREYWRQRLANPPEPLNLQFSAAKTGLTSTRRVFRVPAGRQREIEEFCRWQETTLFRFMMAVFYAYLSRAYIQNDIIIGTAYFNRTSRRELNTIGMYVSTIPVRITAAGTMSFAGLLSLIHRQMAADMAHQQYPYNLLAQDLRKAGRDPASLLNINLVQIPNGKDDKYVLQAHYQGADPALLNMVINPNQLSKGVALEIALDYRTDIFTVADIERLYNCLLAIIEEVLPDPEKKLSHLAIMPEAERQQILIGFNDTYLPVPKDKTYVDLFSEQAAKTPDNIAVIDHCKRLTYAEVDQLTDRLAVRLRELGVLPDSIVGIMLPRTADLVIATLAIMKAGGAYLPISPDYPPGRIRHLIEDSQIKVLLGVEQFKEKAVGFTGTFIDLGRPDLFDYPRRKLEKINKPSDLAYIIYTSGSTGKPKGVMISHANLINLCMWHNNQYQTTAEDVSALYFNPSFDASVKQIFPFLIRGGGVLIIPEELLLDISGLNKYLTANKVTFIGLPTQFAETFAESCDISFLKYMIVGGEKLRSYKPRSYRLINEYGPTEFTVCSTYFSVNQEFDNIPIGKPVANSWAYVLDNQGALQPMGIPGELCLAGAQIARGYLNRPELTAEKFVANPYATGPENALMYKTGDLVRWRPDGNLEYLGRIDMQVKIRGYRIELGEIELAILNFPGIKNAVVIDLPDTSGSKYLCAYLVAETTIDIAKLKQYIAKELPAYMVPGAWLQIPAIPVNQNGKVDRRALPVPDRSDSEHEYAAPTTELQTALSKLWEETLGVSRVGIKDDFFALGGTSIKAIALQTKLQRSLGIQIAAGDIFNNPTPELLAVLVEGTDKYLPIPVAPPVDSYPLTPPQRQMYILRQTLTDETVYNIPAAFTVKGPVNKERLETAFTNLINRHVALRTYFVDIQGEPRQKLTDQFNFRLLCQTAPSDEVGDIIAGYNYPFDLAAPLLFRAGLITVAKDEHILFFIAHHIILDGLSIEVLINDLLALYDGQNLPPVRIGYPDFAVWQQGRLTETALAVQEKYWLDLYADEIPVLELATDWPRPAVMSHKGAVVAQTIDKDLTRALNKLARESKTTLFTVLLTGYMALLARYTGKEDVVVGVPFAGRVHPDIETTVGMFVHTLPLRSRPADQKTLRTLLAEVKQQVGKAQENQDYSLEILVQKLGIRPDLSRNPLFDVLFNFLPPVSRETSRDLKIEPYELEDKNANFDLILNIHEREDNLQITLTYCTELFYPATVERMLLRYLTLLPVLAANPDTPIKDVALLVNQERELLLDKFNDTYLPVPKDKTYVDLFSEQVAKTPDNIAVIDHCKKLTYAELDQLTDSLAARLRELGVLPDSIVGIMFPRTANFVIGALAVMKARGAYLFIDPKYPEARISHMLADSKVAVLLSSEEFKGKVPDFNQTFINLATPGLLLCPPAKREKTNKPSDLAYIIYTSGSTGKPKGVMITQANLVNLAVWHNNHYQIAEQDVSAAYSSFSFDVSVKQIFPFLLTGARVHILPEELLLDLAGLSTYFEANKVTFADLPTQMAETFIENYDNKCLRYLTTGGDKLRTYTPRSYHLINEYGPTEFTVSATYFTVDKQYANIPIGKPLGNSWAYVLDNQEALQPMGIPGELCLAGAQIAKGYLNRPELTAEKFVANPYATGPENALMYKTGDLVRWRPDGNLEYLGRIDMQVKIRGYRIELGEIELAILNFPGIENAVVIDLPDTNGSKYLCAYLVAEKTVDIAELKQFIAKDLPPYMVPSVFRQIAAIPYNVSGKVDRRALPVPDLSKSKTAYTAPRNEREEKLAAIWQAILGVERVGLNDNFFDLGGHSLKVTVLINKVYQAFKVKVTFQEVFSSPVLKDFVALVNKAAKTSLPAIEPNEKLPCYPLLAPQKKMLNFALKLAGNSPLPLEIKGKLDAGRLWQALDTLVERHEILRTVIDLGAGHPGQIVADKVVLERKNRQVAPAGMEQAVHAFLRPFKLNQLLFRAELWELAADRHILMMDIHHIIFDGASVGILMKELMAAYAGKELPPLAIQYRDYSLWQDKLLKSGGFKEMEDYWRENLAGAQSCLELPTDLPRPAVPDYTGKDVNFDLSPATTRQVYDLALQAKTTAHVVIMAVYAIWLAKYAGKNDITFEEGIAGRNYPEVENLIGMFVNVIPIRSFPAGRKTFREFLGEMKATLLKGYEYQEYPVAELAEELGLNIDPDLGSLQFDTGFVYQSLDIPPIRTADWEMKIYPLSAAKGIARRELMMVVNEAPDRLILKLVYRANLFQKSTIEGMSKEFVDILTFGLANPDEKLAAVL